MKICYVDMIAGASGDMLLGALVDSGFPLDSLKKELHKLNLDEFSLSAERITKNGFGATKVHVDVKDDSPERHLKDLKAVVESSSLDQDIKDIACRIFTRICEAEAYIHGSEVEKVHLHEVGGIDAIVDVCGVLAGFKYLSIDQVIISAFPVGRGFVYGAHGEIPLPAPAAISLMKGFPIAGSQIDQELVTPTGAALLTELADGAGTIPAMQLDAIGYGAGTRDLDIPNVVRFIIGESTSTAGVIRETLVQLETNIDDESPEVLGMLREQLESKGALDVMFIPCQMKKNRPAVQIQVLCEPKDAHSLEHVFFHHSSTIGVRQKEVLRDSLPREIREVETKYGTIKIKLATLPNGKIRATPEFDDCREAALKHNCSVKDVYHEAKHASEHAFHHHDGHIHNH